MITTKSLGLFFSVVLFISFECLSQKEIEISIDERVEALLSKMTLKEKIGQMNQ